MSTIRKTTPRCGVVFRLYTATRQANRMKISAVKPFAYKASHRNIFIVKIETDDGLYGVGEAGTSGRERALAGAINHFAQFLVGEDPRRIEHIWQLLYRGQYFEGGTILAAALSAVDIALWDLKGKHFGVPVWELLGGNCRDKIRLHILSGGPTPEKMYDATKQAIEDGFTAIKFDPFSGGFQNMAQDRLIKNATEIVAAAREAGGPDMDLIVEVHRKLTPMVAVAVGEALIPFNLYFMEDPIQIDTPS